MISRREVMAHKCQGNDGCLSGSESRLSESTGNLCSSLCRQHDNGSLSQQDGNNPFQDFFISEPPDLGLVHRKESLDGNDLCSRETEHSCRQTVTPVASEHRIVSRSLSIQESGGSVRSSSSRSVCISTKSLSAPVRFLAARSKRYSSGYI